MKTTYPQLFEQAAFVEAQSQLDQFEQALQAAQAELSEIRATARNAPPENAIERARALMAGATAQTTGDRERHLWAVVDGLQAAIKEQQQAVTAATRAESIKAATHFKAEHQRRAQRVLAALVELHDANEDERALQGSITRMGYEQRLPGMAFEHHALDLRPVNPNGGFTPRWFKDATEYVGS